MPEPTRPRPSATATDHIERILADIAARHDEATQQKQNFTSLTKEELRQRSKKTKAPLIAWQAWNPSARTGTHLIYNAGVANPEPTPWSAVFLFVFVGPVNIRIDARDGPPGVGLGMRDSFSFVDPRFPRLIMPDFTAPALEPGETRSLSVVLPISQSVEPSNYLGSTLLLQAEWHGRGQYLDNSVFLFQLT